MVKGLVALLASFGLVFMMAGCAKKEETAPKDPKLAQYDFSQEKTFVVYGEGIAPQNTISPAQAIALAKRAAITDGYRQLGEKLYGVKINSTETIRDAMLKDSRITAQVNALIKNATVTDATFKDGLYSVRMEIPMSARRWQEIFAY
jgi:hypothetical protein